MCCCIEICHRCAVDCGRSRGLQGLAESSASMPRVCRRSPCQPNLVSNTALTLNGLSSQVSNTQVQLRPNALLTEALQTRKRIFARLLLGHFVAVNGRPMNFTLPQTTEHTFLLRSGSHDRKMLEPARRSALLMTHQLHCTPLQKVGLRLPVWDGPASQGFESHDTAETTQSFTNVDRAQHSCCISHYCEDLHDLNHTLPCVRLQRRLKFMAGSMCLAHQLHAMRRQI